MRLAIKVVLLLAILGTGGLVGFALVSDLPAPSREISIPVETQ